MNFQYVQYFIFYYIIIVLIDIFLVQNFAIKKKSVHTLHCIINDLNITLSSANFRCLKNYLIAHIMKVNFQSMYFIFPCLITVLREKFLSANFCYF